MVFETETIMFYHISWFWQFGLLLEFTVGSKTLKLWQLACCPLQEIIIRWQFRLFSRNVACLHAFAPHMASLLQSLWILIASVWPLTPGCLVPVQLGQGRIAHPPSKTHMRTHTHTDTKSHIILASENSDLQFLTGCRSRSLDGWKCHLSRRSEEVWHWIKAPPGSWPTEPDFSGLVPKACP